MQRTASFVLLAMTLAASVAAADERTAIFAAGCFWCVEPPYDEVDGVLETVSGYTGGHAESPTYEQVTYGATGHLEAVLVRYDATKVSYQALLKIFWRNVDPFDNLGQFCDKGSSYRPAIFVDGDGEERLADASKTALEAAYGERIAVRILPRKTFYPAEDYHQDYYLKNPLRYKFYRYRCGRDQRLEALRSRLQAAGQASR